MARLAICRIGWASPSPVSVDPLCNCRGERFDRDRRVPAPLIESLDELLSFVGLVEVEVTASLERGAMASIGACDPMDWPIIATALALDCSIWTEDRDFFGCRRSDVDDLPRRNLSTWRLKAGIDHASDDAVHYCSPSDLADAAIAREASGTYANESEVIEGEVWRSTNGANSAVALQPFLTGLYA